LVVVVVVGVWLGKRKDWKLFQKECEEICDTFMRAFTLFLNLMKLFILGLISILA
jgi:hypothetical protein